MLAGVTFGWGLITTFTGFCSGPSGYHSMIACRVLLGVVESAFFPCAALYLTYHYTREELGLRTSYLFVAAAMSGAFGGLLAYGIFHMEGVSGMHGWQWLYILVRSTFVRATPC